MCFDGTHHFCCHSGFKEVPWGTSGHFPNNLLLSLYTAVWKSRIWAALQTPFCMNFPRVSRGRVGGAASCLARLCCLGPPNMAPSPQNLNPPAPSGTGPFPLQNLLTLALPLLSLPLAIAVGIIRVPARGKDVILCLGICL